MTTPGFAPVTNAATLRALWSHFEAGRAQRLASLLCREARLGRAAMSCFVGHPLEDDWRDFASQSLQEYLQTRRGRVYVVTNPVNAGLYKVGQTREDMAARLKSLNSAGVVGYFVEVHSVVVSDRFYVERAAQRRLAQSAARHKEFFQCDFGTAMQALQVAAAADEAALARLAL